MGHSENRASLPEVCMYASPFPEGSQRPSCPAPNSPEEMVPGGASRGHTRSQYLLCCFSQALTSAQAPLAVIPCRWGLAWERLPWGQVAKGEASSERDGRMERPSGGRSRPATVVLALSFPKPVKQEQERPV